MNKIDKKWQLKIICLLLAIVLWFVIINEQNPLSEGSYTVPITVENLDSQYITSNVPKTVYVRLSGPRNTIINVGPSDIKAYIDLSSVQEGGSRGPGPHRDSQRDGAEEAEHDVDENHSRCLYSQRI